MDTLPLLRMIYALTMNSSPHDPLLHLPCPHERVSAGRKKGVSQPGHCRHWTLGAGKILATLFELLMHQGCLSQRREAPRRAGAALRQADTGMTAAELEQDWGMGEPVVEPRVIDPAMAAPKAFPRTAEEPAAPGQLRRSSPRGCKPVHRLNQCCQQHSQHAPSLRAHAPPDMLTVHVVLLRADAGASAQEIDASGLPFNEEARDLLRQAAAIQAAPRGGAGGVRAGPAPEGGARGGQAHANEGKEEPGRSFLQ